MSRRWFTGAMLFALGFGCAKLVTLSAAGAAATDGVVDGTLEYIDGEESFELFYPSGGETEYLVIASRISAPGTTTPPQISYDTGSTVIFKHDLASLMVFRVEPLLRWDADTLLKRRGSSQLKSRGNTQLCDPSGPILCTIPPPPRPPIWHHFRTLTYKRL